MLPTDQTVWFAESIQPHEPALRAFLSRRFSSLPDHDDLIQETYVRLLRLTDQQRLLNVRAFLFTIARNVAIDHTRRTRRRPVGSLDETSEIDAAYNAPDAIEMLDRAQRYEVMLQALETLPVRCREIMLLRYVDGLTSQEIAQHLGLAAATVRVHLMKGVRDCARFFRAQGLFESKLSTKGES